MTDPNFPNRPDHPDFWLISQALIDTDAQADSGQSMPDIAGRIVDTASLMYAAEQRVKLITGKGHLNPSARILIAMQALWLDAFVAGTRYQHLKTQGAQIVPDDGTPAPLRVWKYPGADRDVLRIVVHDVDSEGVPHEDPSGIYEINLMEPFTVHEVDNVPHDWAELRS